MRLECGPRRKAQEAFHRPPNFVEGSAASLRADFCHFYYFLMFAVISFVLEFD
jgi:hypothetical protein